jgi:hypothetical protein
MFFTFPKVFRLSNSNILESCRKLLEYVKWGVARDHPQDPRAHGSKWKLARTGLNGQGAAGALGRRRRKLLLAYAVRRYDRFLPTPERPFLAVFCWTNQAFARKIGLSTTSVENIGLTPVAADQ